MKKLLTICTGLLLGWSATAASTNFLHFSDSSLPSQPGEYNCSYSSTNNPNVVAMLTFVTNSSGIAPPSQGPTWDFSQPRQSYESVQRADIINPTNGIDGSDFPDATYAEQDSQECMGDTNFLGWTYYSISDDGRVNYGTYTPGTPLDGLAQYDPPIVDVPATVTNGQAWTLATSWYSTYDDYRVYYFQFSSTSTVDAYGTLILPNIGAVPAWRVHEVDVTYGFFLGDGSLALIETNQLYNWLVPGVGVAVQIAVYGANTVNPGPLPLTNSVERMYYASYFTNSFPTGPSSPTVGNLHIQLQSGSVVLNWDPFTNNPTSYQVQANGSLCGTNWQSLGLTSGTNWTDSPSLTQRFYRVIGLP